MFIFIFDFTKDQIPLLVNVTYRKKIIDFGISQMVQISR